MTEFIYTLFEIIISLANLIIYPLDLLISMYLPDVTEALSSVGGFFDIAFSTIGWCISALGIPPLAISFIIMFYGFKLTLPLFTYSIKLIINWYNSLTS